MSIPPSTPIHANRPRATPNAALDGALDAPQCPLCHQPNRCAAAANGHFDGPCWCQRVRFSATLLTSVPDQLRGQACICQACAERSPPPDQAEPSLRP